MADVAKKIISANSIHNGCVVVKTSANDVDGVCNGVNDINIGEWDDLLTDRLDDREYYMAESTPAPTTPAFTSAFSSAYDVS